MAVVADYGVTDGRDCDHPSNCDREAVATVPEPNVIGGWSLCDYHLALWADTRGNQETLRDLDVDHLVAEDRFLTLDEAPPELQRDVRYRRIGVDHRGLAHYHVAGRPDEDADRVITVDADLELVDVYDVPPHVGLNGWVEHVFKRRAWVELENRFCKPGGESV